RPQTGEFDGFAAPAAAGMFDACANANRDLRAEAETHVVFFTGKKPDDGRPMQLDPDLGDGLRQMLARADEEWDALPAPGIDEQADCRERLDVGIGRDVLFLAVAAILAAHD